MQNFLKLSCTLGLFFLVLACLDNKSAKKASDQVTPFGTTEIDTLRFTSGIRVIFQDSKGNYWLGSHQEGVCIYNGRSFTYFTTNEGLSNNQIRSIQEDASGTIWIVTSGGVNRYNEGLLSKQISEDGITASNWIVSSGELWFYANEEDGIYRSDGVNFNYLTFPKPTGANPNSSYGVTDISKDNLGKVWIATYSALFSYASNIITSYDDTALQLDEGDRLHIRSVLADSKGRVWIGNNGIGVLLREGPKTMNFSQSHHLIHPASTRSGGLSPAGTLEHVFAMEEDAAGNIWFGDRDTGAWKYDGKTVVNYTVDKELSTPMIWCIYKDDDNNLLFGMESGGVYQFNGEFFTRVF